MSTSRDNYGHVDFDCFCVQNSIATQLILSEQTKKVPMSSVKKQQLVLAEARSMFVRSSALMDRFVTYAGGAHATEVQYINKSFNAEVNRRVNIIKLTPEAVMNVIIAGATINEVHTFSYAVVTALMSKLQRSSNVTTLDMTSSNGPRSGARFLLFFMRRAVVMCQNLRIIATNESNEWILQQNDGYVFYGRVTAFTRLSIDEMSQILRHAIIADDKPTIRKFSDHNVNVYVLEDMCVHQPRQFSEEDGGITLCFHHQQPTQLKVIRFVLYQHEGNGTWTVRSLLVSSFLNSVCDKCV